MIFTLVFTACSAHKITGQVYTSTHSPLPDVSIRPIDGPTMSQSGIDGQYQIEVPLQARIQIDYLKPGYAPYRLELSCSRRKCTAPIVVLQPIDLTLPYQPELLQPILDRNSEE